MPCCSCKRAGTCQRCACFTSGVSCSDCYPSWDNRCKNGGNTASASMSSSSSGSSTRSARRLFQGNQEQSRRITNNMADFAQVSLRSHSQPVPVSSDVLFNSIGSYLNSISACYLNQRLFRSADVSESAYVPFKGSASRIDTVGIGGDSVDVRQSIVG